MASIRVLIHLFFLRSLNSKILEAIKSVFVDLVCEIFQNRQFVFSLWNLKFKKKQISPTAPTKKDDDDNCDFEYTEYLYLLISTMCFLLFCRLPSLVSITHVTIRFPPLISMTKRATNFQISFVSNLYRKWMRCYLASAVLANALLYYTILYRSSGQQFNLVSSLHFHSFSS